MGSTRWGSLPNPPPSPATTSARCAAVPPRHSVHAAMKKWRIVYIRVWHGATGLERSTNPQLSRRTCTCDYGLQFWRGTSVAVAKRLCEVLSHRNRKTLRRRFGGINPTLTAVGSRQLLHARWAMLAAVGALIPEALAMNGVELGEPLWWKVGKTRDWFLKGLQGGQPILDMACGVQRSPDTPPTRWATPSSAATSLSTTPASKASASPASK
jgi:hypothetical protein